MTANEVNPKKQTTFLETPPKANSATNTSPQSSRPTTTVTMGKGNNKKIAPAVTFDVKGEDDAKYDNMESKEQDEGSNGSGIHQELAELEESSTSDDTVSNGSSDENDDENDIYFDQEKEKRKIKQQATAVVVKGTGNQSMLSLIHI